MKLRSIILSGLAAVALTACDESFEWDAQPQVNEQGAVATFSDGTVSAVASTVDLGSLSEDASLVQILNITAPTSSDADYAPAYQVELSATKADGSVVTNVYDITAAGEVAVSDLQDFLVQAYGSNPDAVRTVSAVLYSTLSNGGSATTYKSAPVSLSAKVKAPYIDPDGYYMVGNWDGWTCKRVDAMHAVNGGGDVYDDPVFSLSFAPVDGIDTYEIKFVPASGFAADGSASDWSHAISAEPDKDEAALEGTVSVINAGGNIKFDAVSGAKEYKVSFDALNGTYKVEPQFGLFYTGSEYGWGGTWNPFFEVNTNWGGDQYKRFFWVIKYCVAGEQIKFAPQQGWGNDFGSNGEGGLVDADNLGVTGNGDGNVVFANAGWYLIEVDANSRKVIVRQPAVYGIGNACDGKWDANMPAWKFSVPTTADGEFVSPAFTATTDGRMYVDLELTADGDWWRTEFNIVDGDIHVRGYNDGDANTPVEQGKKAYLNFTTMKGSVK